MWMGSYAEVTAEAGYLRLLAHKTHTAEYTPGITELHTLRLFQCHDDQYDAGSATNVLLDVCLTFVISKHPLRRCTLLNSMLLSCSW